VDSPEVVHPKGWRRAATKLRRSSRTPETYPKAAGCLFKLTASCAVKGAEGMSEA